MSTFIGIKTHDDEDQSVELMEYSFFKFDF